jgi:hypothetical protein
MATAKRGIKKRYENLKQNIELAPLKVHFLSRTARSGFHLLAGINRPVKQPHVNTLVESVRLMGIIRPVVITTIAFITGRPLRYIIDGQHLFHACLALDVDIPYTEITVKNQTELVERIALLNSSSKSWDMSDYITAWSSISQHYKTLNYYIERYKQIDYRTLAAALSGGTASNSISFTLKAGKFVVFDENTNSKVIEELAEANEALGSVYSLQRRNIHRDYLSFRRSIVNYNHKAFMKAMRENHDKIIMATTRGEHVMDLFKKMHKG